MSPIRLVVLGGTGDVYLVCALAAAFQRAHGREAIVVTREKFGAVCDLFPGVAREYREDLVYRGENDRRFQIEHDNRIDGPDGVFYTHPCFERSRVRVDHLTVKADVSQADMYRMLLRVPPDAPLSMPIITYRPGMPGTVLLIPDAVSWPNTQPEFWRKLEVELAAAGRVVIVNDPKWSMGELFKRCAESEWVIGPQCGVMSILVTGGFPCRKTLATPSVDDERAPGFLALQTFPYAYVTKFANNDYDVEEFKVSIESRDDVIRAICSGANFHRIMPHNPGPLHAITVPMAPGEVLDRLAVLTVKRHRFPPRRRAAVERDYQRYSEVARELRKDSRVEGWFQRMVILHEETFDIFERAIPLSMRVIDEGWPPDNPPLLADHIAAVSLNRARTDLRREIDAAFGCAFSEVKSYYSKDDTP